MDIDHQAFRRDQLDGSSSLNPIVNIEVSTDSTTGAKFVFWEDIETFFPGLRHVHRNGNIMVAFMRDKAGQRYNPARIKHYPGMVLHVTTAGYPPAALRTGGVDEVEGASPPEYAASSADISLMGSGAGSPSQLQAAPNDGKQAMLPSSRPAGVPYNNQEVSNHQVWTPPSPPILKAHDITSIIPPQLFIILPSKKTSSTQDLSLDQRFRIHFLCEGGEEIKHGTPGNNTSNTIPGHVHLCGHPGYELNRPTEFFDCYGPYVLNILQKLKHGFPVNGKIVPFLKDLEYVKVRRGSWNSVHLMETADDIEASVDEVIGHLQSIKADKTFEEKVKAGDLNDDGRTDLSKVLSFLKDLSENETGEAVKHRPLGGLYSEESDDGQVVWLCHHHHQTQFDTDVLTRLRDTVLWNDGVYEFERGILRLTLRPSKSATPEYLLSHLGPVRDVRELDLVLEWDASYQDLLTTRDWILGMQRLQKLRLDCGRHTGSILDRVGRNKRLDPMVHVLTASSCLQSIDIIHAEDLFSKSSVFAALHQTQVREIHLDALFDPKMHSDKLRTIFNKSPHLATLTLCCSSPSFCGTIELVKELSMDHTHFRLLNLSSVNFKIRLDRSEPGSPLLDPIRFNEPPLLLDYMVLERYGAHLHTLLIGDRFRDEDASVLDAITQQSQNMKLEQIDFHVDYNALTISRLTSVGKQTLSKTLKRLYLSSVDSPSPLSIPSAVISQSDPKKATLATASSSLSSLVPEKVELEHVVSIPTPSSSSAPLRITFTSRYMFEKWTGFIGDIFPYLMSLDYASPHGNKYCLRLYDGISHASQNQQLQQHQHSIMQSFTFRGTHSTLKETGLRALLQILSMCPLLETFQWPRGSLTGPQWEELLGALDYSRLKVLNLKGCNFGVINFPTHVIPKDGGEGEGSDEKGKVVVALEELTISKSPMTPHAKEATVKKLKEQVPRCRIIV
ncbi:hypothetical protein BC939DRAFT_334701 [Gamsiella multidivaricata]|uniref:uncharacterized protein n=1 Tax=Gamsiella multidivaricata TaxID=101098 RepID=UPI00221F20C3|nr:uncharacterized protein BC939DRAFT_334701 [Gamsiella multidivaricata]KAG0359215.1 hypothetical protein BGZ54_010041 [Gamsiella multidivaricata]KAI7817278.1 hypothetical protein BC939DRAFT_334701 [Gamsiella multidivaricata]